jgi:hypothetical protein
MTNSDQVPEDIGAPQSYLVLKDDTPVYDRSGDRVGAVSHVLADDREDIFHGLIIKTSDGHRFAGADQIDGIYEHAVIVSVPGNQLPVPAEDAVPESGLRRAWDWLVEPR